MYKTREEVESWLEEMSIQNYVINEDLTVDVQEYIDLSYKELKEIPINFGIVNGDFYCNDNSLTSLEGCPKEVGGHFYCNDNKLTSLAGCPKEVGERFFCSNNHLTSLEGCPKEINDNFYCFGNKLTNLEGCPEVVDGSFDCDNNNLTSLEYFPKEINGDFISMKENEIKEEELFNFNCNIEKVINIYSDFNEYGNIEEFLGKVNCQKIKKENELLKELVVNSNNVKLNKKL